MPIRAIPAHKQPSRPPVTLAERIRRDTKHSESRMFEALYRLNKHHYQVEEAKHVNNK